MKKVLSIAGSDSSGGAGIQADIKTMAAHNVFAMTAITAVTAQNTLGVTAIQDISVDVVENQLDAVFTDIFPDAVKIGMVSSKEIIRIIARKLEQYPVKNVVLDPVMVSTSGSRLLEQASIDSLMGELIPLADIITPNLYEAEILSGMEIRSLQQLQKAGEIIFDKTRVHVLVKGGHLEGKKVDILISSEGTEFFEGPHIDNPNTHGTGCTLSSAIASNLALGKELRTAVRDAKAYVSRAISYGLDLGKGSGPLNHMVGVYSLSREAAR